MSKQLITKIEPGEIEQLGSDSLVRLLHRLLLCEAKAAGLRRTGILVPYQITVPDGGSDGEWRGECAPNEFIPRKWTRYQCKAERITEARCRDEIAPLDKHGTPQVKARVREVLAAGGCYAFFSNKHEVKPSEDDDLDTIARDQIRKAQFTPAKDALIEFFGCNRIADWTNKFPSVVRYVREINKAFGGVHYFTFDGWSKLSDVSGCFYSNKPIQRKIGAIRDALLDGTRLIRLTGLSGVGKTRLVYEALRPSNGDNPDQDSLSASCIYISYEGLSSDLLGLIAHFADNNYSAIVVVDDCPASIHDRIANIVGQSLLSVVTIFHEPQQRRGDSYPLILTPEEMGDVVENILREDLHLSGRGEGAIKAVASFAQGFPQIAKLIAEFHRAPTMDELSDRAKLFQKLLSCGENPNDITLLTAQSIALFRTIGGSTAKLESHMSIIRGLFCPQITEFDYRRSIEAQKKRRVIQRVADTLALTPRPLAVALAANFFSFFPPGRWKDAVATLAEVGLLREFQRRIEELEFSDRAEELGEMFLEVGLPFEDEGYLLTGTGSRMFRSLTALSPLTAIKIAKVLNKTSIDVLQNAKNPRRDLVRALELLVWEPETFLDAAELLLRLAAAENEGWTNNATGAFKQLFSLHLSGTKVPALERLTVLRNAIKSPEPAIRSVAIDALGAALEFRHFSRMDDTTMGGKRDAQKDWQPKSDREALDYWRECFLILRAILSGGKDAEIAKASLGKNIGVILQTPLLLELDGEFKELSESMSQFWPEVKDEIKTILSVSKRLTEPHRSALERWEAYFTPADSALEARLLDSVVKPGWHQRKEEDGSFTDLSREEAERVASKLAANRVDIVRLLPQLLKGEQQQTFSFGAVLGQVHPDALRLIDATLELWPSLDRKERNASLPRGIMRGLGRENALLTATLDRVAGDDRLIDLLGTADDFNGASR